MKRISIMLVIILCISILSTDTCLGMDSNQTNITEAPVIISENNRPQQQVLLEEEQFILNYISVLSAKVHLSISGGKATMTAQVTPKSEAAMTSGSVSIELINQTTGKTKTFLGTMSKLGQMYIYSKAYTLSEKGNYYVKATIKCYKKGQLTDTIKRNTTLVSY